MIFKIIKSAFISYVFRRIIREADVFLFSSSLPEADLIECLTCNSIGISLGYSKHNCPVCCTSIKIDYKETTLTNS